MLPHGREAPELRRSGHPGAGGPGRMLGLGLLVLGVLAVSAPAGAGGAPGAPGGPAVIDYIEITGLFDPASAQYLFGRIRAAEDGGASALVVRVDTDGAAGVSASEIAGRVSRARVPVVVWVAPARASAPSVAAFLVAAAHVSVMAPAATVGPASAEIPNDPTPRASRTRSQAYLAGLLRQKLNERDATAVENGFFTVQRARQAGLADFQAGSLQSLLQGLSGRSVEVDGRRATLAEGPFLPRFHKMSVLGRLLHGSARPAAAYLLLLGGVFALLFELYNPGVGGAAVAGGTALGFSLYGFSVLPTFWAALALVLLGVLMLAADLQRSTLGVLSGFGLVGLLGGSLGLFAGAPEGMNLAWWAVIAGLAGTLGFFFSVLTAAIRSRTARPLSGAENIVGTLGVARTDISPDGQVMARGTLWRARTLGAAIPQGASVEIKGISGLMLLVEQAERESPEPQNLAVE